MQILRTILRKRVISSTIDVMDIITTSSWLIAFHLCANMVQRTWIPPVRSSREDAEALPQDGYRAKRPGWRKKYLRFLPYEEAHKSALALGFSSRYGSRTFVLRTCSSMLCIKYIVTIRTS